MDLKKVYHDLKRLEETSRTICGYLGSKAPIEPDDRVTYAQALLQAELLRREIVQATMAQVRPSH